MNQRLSRAVLAATVSLLAVPAAAQVPVSSLVRQVTIPHSSFKLANGLTVIVHEDHKAPVTAVTVWYNVGSKDEPAGKTGFAHLFEHLMFNGSENLPGDYFKYLQQIGATDTNGTTSFDRTNYYQTVPAGALERALFLESDRMGYLLGAITQGVLDNQRGVVQNEKRQGDSRPGGLAQYAIFENLFPVGHPYRHTTIGSMADLDAASLGDVKDWFRSNYGPNNAVLAIAGDVRAADVRPLVEKYFGAIPRGPVNRPAQATVPTLAAPKRVELKDQVATTTIQRYWAVPGVLDRRLAALDIGGSILGGLASSRLDNILVRDEKLAVGVRAGLSPLQRAGLFSVSVAVTPGTDPDVVGRRLDAIIADFLAKGPTADEVQRAVMSEVSGRIQGLEQVGGSNGKAQTLAEGQTLAGNANFYRSSLASYAAVTPAAVRTAMKQWLGRPALTLILSPGERGAYSESKTATAATAPPAPAAPAAATPPKRTPPPVAPAPAFAWPQIERTTLANGIPVTYARRTTLPITQIALAFDAGTAADTPNQRGLAAMATDLLEEGTAKYTSQQLAETEERLGAQLGIGNSGDRSNVFLTALTPNLAPSLDLVEEVVERPTFPQAEIDRVRAQTLTSIAQLMKDPTRVGGRILPQRLWGPNHPYGGPAGGDPAAVSKFTRADFVNFHQRWMRPDNVKIFIVSDRPLAEIKGQLEQRFGDWSAPGVAKGVKRFTPPPPRPSSPQILLIDRPGAPQATIIGGQRTPLDPRGDLVAFSTANQVLGGDFLSRLNMDLREEKGWSYGTYGSPSVQAGGVAYTVRSPVQIDRAGESVAALSGLIGDYLSAKGTTGEELEANVTNLINGLPGEFETSGSLLQALMSNDLLGRPDDYYTRLPSRYRALTAASLDAAARGAIDPKAFIWVVTGDAAKIRPQLEKLGIPIEVVEPK